MFPGALRCAAARKTAQRSGVSLVAWAGWAGPPVEVWAGMLTLLLTSTLATSPFTPTDALHPPEAVGSRVRRTALATTTGAALGFAAMATATQLGCGPEPVLEPIDLLTGGLRTLSFAYGCMYRQLGVGAGVGGLSLLAMGSPSAVHRLMGGHGRGWVGLLAGLAGGAVAAGPGAFFVNSRAPMEARLGVALGGLMVAGLIPALAMELDSGRQEAPAPGVVSNLTMKFAPTAGGVAVSLSGDF